MKAKPVLSSLFLSFGLIIAGLSSAPAKPSKSEPATPLSDSGKQLEQKYAAGLAALKKEIEAALPRSNTSKLQALERAREAVAKAQEGMAAAAKNMGAISQGHALVAHAKGKWIGTAVKGIAKAKQDLAKAKTAAEKEAAMKDLANWEANKKDGEDALKERQAALDKALKNQAAYQRVEAQAKADLEKAQAAEKSAVNSLLSDLAASLDSNKMDARLAKAAMVAWATPNGLAAFAQEDSAKQKLVDDLLANDALVLEMMVAGGARFGNFGRAIEIYSAIQQASPKAASGNLQRLALATALEHARPVAQSAPKNAVNPPTVVDPVKRYLHYEKAFLDGELDPAFKDLTTWEYRFVVNCDAPDEILSWGRQMLRNYRPDHISNPNYGWRYVSTVKTEVPYGSQNVKFDDPANHNYQNIIRNGGICGRRAFFGRFLLRAFGIPTWGVTQRAHAALSHWTPDGWVVNLGAGYSHSWWDKDDVSLSGTQFVNDAKARAHGADYLRVCRAHWISRIMGEEAYNHRRQVEGGFWSNVANYVTLMLADKAATLGPLGQELGEANEKAQKIESDNTSAEDLKISESGGVITIPAVAYEKSSGKGAKMKSYRGGMQLHALGGFKTSYTFDAPQAGKYLVSADLCTVQTGQKIVFTLAGSGDAQELEVPYTLGMWQKTDPLTITLKEGANTLDFQLADGSRGVTIKEITLTPVK